MEDVKQKPLTIEGVKAILSKINFAKYSMLDFEWDFEVKVQGDLFLMRTTFMRKDIDSGEWDKGFGRWHTTPIDSSEKGIVMTAWVCIKMIIEHELLEGFEYKEKKVFDPHKSLEALVYPEKL